MPTGKGHGGSSHPNRGTAPIATMSQHKRSLSFNHHLSYNNYHNNQHQNNANLKQHPTKTQETTHGLLEQGGKSGINTKGNAIVLFVHIFANHIIEANYFDHKNTKKK